MTTVEVPRTSVESENLNPVTGPRQCTRRVAAYTITEQNTPSTPAAPAAVPRADFIAAGARGTKNDPANAAASPANKENAMISRLSHEVRSPKNARNA